MSDVNEQIGCSSVEDRFCRNYRVLARRYRPTTFADLIGQKALVRTLTNAFQTGRIAQGYILTGVRGVGKTTTARIIARALNHQLPSGPDVISTSGELGIHCTAILESRHVDVIEMDAASHTGIGDIREIIESVCYKPVSARYKVYIIDEVHMLSDQAFNGLLKTLEEPPEHVKFILATTRIHKVPITILSRCQRFDLRRIEAIALFDMMRSILIREGVQAEDDALMMIAQASDGSARDALSMLDQAIAHSGALIDAVHVRDMLGIADSIRIIDLFRAVIGGNVSLALTELRDHYEMGSDPVAIISSLANFVYLVTRIKYIPEAGSDVTLSEKERSEGMYFADKLDTRVLSRAWQVLLKGIEETRISSWPLASAEMLIVRLSHMSGFPTPNEVIRMLKTETTSVLSRNGASCANKELVSVVQEQADSRLGEYLSAGKGETVFPSVSKPDSFSDIVALAGEKRELQLKMALKKYVRPVRFGLGHVEIMFTDDAPVNLATDLAACLMEWTGMSWMVSVVTTGGGSTLDEQERTASTLAWSEANADEAVAGLLMRFPGSEIADVRDFDVPVSIPENSL